MEDMIAESGEGRGEGECGGRVGRLRTGVVIGTRATHRVATLMGGHVCVRNTCINVGDLCAVCTCKE